MHFSKSVLVFIQSPWNPNNGYNYKPQASPLPSMPSILQKQIQTLNNFFSFPFSPVSCAHSPAESLVFETDFESLLRIPLRQEENKKPFYESLTEYCYSNKHNSELLKHFLMRSIYTDSSHTALKHSKVSNQSGGITDEKRLNEFQM